MGSNDVRLRVGSPEVVRDLKKNIQRVPAPKEEKNPKKEVISKSGIMEGNVRSVKDEDDKTT